MKQIVLILTASICILACSNNKNGKSTDDKVYKDFTKYVNPFIKIDPMD
ncbi:MAG TPA: hypothetical protein VKX35_00190 [Fermentimonas sp.]|nr:hypothetical protein [Fermentimonas sp.]